MPAPAKGVNLQRIRVKDSVEYIDWLGKTARPKACNANVLQAYSKDMLRLIERGIAATKRPSGRVIKGSFMRGQSRAGRCTESSRGSENSERLW